MGLFNGAHTFLQNVSGEMEVLKNEIMEDHSKRKMEVVEARQLLLQEKSERREQVNKLRYEFEEFVHRKVDKVLNDIEEIKQQEQKEKKEHEEQYELVISDMELLKNDLVSIQSAWSKLVSDTLTPYDPTLKP